MQLLYTTTTAPLNQGSRAFALFQSKVGKEGQSFDSPVQQQRTQEEIVRSINNYKASIRSKSQQGYALSKSIADTVEANKHLKLQRYEIFIDKMQRLYKSELRFAKKQEQKF